MDASLRNLDDVLRDHFRKGVVAILDAEGMRRVFVRHAANLFRLQGAVFQ